MTRSTAAARAGASAVDPATGPVTMDVDLRRDRRDEMKREPPPVKPEERNTLELIRFATREDRVLAIGALIDRGMLDVYSSAADPEIWRVMTPIPRKLRELGIPFEWLTEHV
jgi:hypothetical protein